ncbi:hypothetical protein DL765_009273 [Monosporascus sp. GIB2]|nr:hypothetical protein DL765_009273 [Monosporascus sp. GIB2]
MEPVGLALGVIGLAGLAYDSGRGAAAAVSSTATVRMLRQIDGATKSARPVSETLHRIATLLQDHRTLSRRYGFSLAEPSRGKSVATSMLGALAPPLSLQASALASLTSPVRYAQKRPAIPSAARWAIGDKQKFEELVLYLKDFIDDLEGFTADYKVPHRQRQFIQAEVESICDVSELEIVEQAQIGGRNPVADAASLRLSRLQRVGNSSSIRPVEMAGSAVGTSASTGFHDWELIPEAADLIDCPMEAYRQVLHRVSCDLQPTAIFLDAPNYDPETGAGGQWLVIDAERCPRAPAALHLSGRRPLHHLGSYLEQNTQLWWLVVKDYTCCHDSHKTREAEPSNTSIQLVSQALCDELNSRDLKIKPLEFTSGMELRPPYDWFYYNRQQLVENTEDALTAPFDRLQGVDDTLCARPATEAHTVAETLLKFIQDSMDEDYQLVSGYAGALADHVVTWELLPLIFEPGKLAVERFPDGDDDFRAFVQADLPRLVCTSDPEPQEVLEIPISGEYLVDETMYKNLKDSADVLTRRVELHEDPCHDEDLSYEYQSDCECSMSYDYPNHDNFDYHPFLDYYSANFRRRQNIMCMPHAVWGFHLRDHVGRKLLVRNIEATSTKHFGFRDFQIQGHTNHQLSKLLTFMGIAILLLPDEPAFPGELDHMAAIRICMNFVFVPEDSDKSLDEDQRREFWQRLISERSNCFNPAENVTPSFNAMTLFHSNLTCSEKENRESRERVASLAAWKLTGGEIRSIVDAALPSSQLAGDKPDWELIDRLVQHRR